MKKSSIILLTILAVLLMGQTVQISAINATSEVAKIAPDVRDAISQAQPDDMVTVIVTMRRQADLQQVVASNRSARLHGVIQALQSISTADQRSIRGYLANKASTGDVAEYESFWIFNGVKVTALPDVITELASRKDVGKITANANIHAPYGYTTASSPAEANIDLTNAPALWSLGYDGQGIVVANMDTGVDVTHPDLTSRWRGGSNSWFDPSGQHPTTPTDNNGHGTWTMGVMVGGDAGGSAVGMAPGAQWIAVKIFDDGGNATTAGIHAGYQWLLDPDGNPNTDDAPNVVNNSWVYGAPGCSLEFQANLQALRAAGIVPVFAAGNYGPNSATDASPANYPEAFAVGAIDLNNGIYSKSSRGPSDCGEASTTYPELVAPGVSIRSTASGGGYSSATGTSLAAPHVAGALALLLSSNPDLAVDQQEAALKNSAFDLGAVGPDNTFGYGRLDVLAAYQWLANIPDPVTDIAITSVVPGTDPVTSGDAVNVNVAVQNLGNQDVSNITVALTASQGITSASQTINLLAGGSTTLIFNWDSTGVAAGQYTLTAAHNISDDNAGNDSLDKTVNVVAPPSPQTMHVGDLDVETGLLTNGAWQARATIAIHDPDHVSVANATVTGQWYRTGNNSLAALGSTVTCVTNSSGICTTAWRSYTNKPNQASGKFVVVSVAHATRTYDSLSNHDPDGAPQNSNGTEIAFSKPAAQPPDPVTDIAITSVVPATDPVMAGDVVNVRVTVQNIGNQDVSNITVSLAASQGLASAPQTINLMAGGSTIVTFMWDSAGVVDGSHTLTATHNVSDSNSGNDSANRTVTVMSSSSQQTMHVGDLDVETGRQKQGAWRARATITIHDAYEGVVANATVTGQWFSTGNGTAVAQGNPVTCVTDTSGICTTSWMGYSKNADQASGKFVVLSVTHGTVTYDSGSNHDPEEAPPSGGTEIAFTKPN